MHPIPQMSSTSIQHQILDKFVVDRFGTFACPKNNSVSKTLTMGQQMPESYAVRTVRCYGGCCVKTSRTLTEREREVVKAKVDEAARLIKEAKDIGRGHWSTNQLNATVKSSESEAGPSRGTKRPHVPAKSGAVKKMKLEGGESVDKPINLTGPPAEEPRQHSTVAPRSWSLGMAWFNPQAPKLITTQAILDDPQILLHKSESSAAVRPFDGQVGNILTNGRFFITSPNADYIPAPPLGETRHVFMRANFRYANDDPIQWPQPYHPSTAHLGAIPRALSNDDLALFWKPPSTIAAGVGSLHSHADRYRTGNNSATATKAIIIMSKFLSDLLDRLTNLPMNENELVRCFAELQRCYLELTAYLDYMLTYKPRMDGIAAPARHLEDTYGTFTMDPLVVQNFVNAGLPVWFIHKIAPLIAPDSLNFSDSHPKFPTIFKGAVTDPRKIEEMRVASRIILHCADVFSWTPAPERSAAPTAGTSASAILRSRPSPVVNSPYRVQKLGEQQRKSLQGRLCTVPTTSPAMPSVPAPWLTALESLQSTSLPFELPTDRGAALPDPSLFLKINNDIHSLRWPYIERYLLLRPLLLIRLTESKACSAARTLPNKIWCQALSMDSEAIATSLAASGKLPRTAAERHEAAIFLSACAMLGATSLSDLLQAKPVYRGEELGESAKDNTRMMKEIVWEVAELNFRIEFMVLASRHTSTLNESEVQELVLSCLCPPSMPRHLLLVDARKASDGLSSPHPSTRLPLLCHMQRLFSSWSLPTSNPTPTPFLGADVNLESATQILTLERQLFTFYALRFFSVFGRSPIVPRHLTT
ncbi:hypothetical protein BKA70DRAFT_1420531 [Coprinopsis sp. MPI-PUGE-AT-0042]|nr:hypothetical protein BKA70DRAFT_1420531 [Coprinopsis sp. MPI-PUGE-AT-0042]